MSEHPSIPPVPPSEPPAAEDPVGVKEIADRLGVASRTVKAMRRRGSLPAPDYPSINGKPAWRWRTILWWAGSTDLPLSRRVQNEYRATFRREPQVDD